jgi:hypothetical protein
VIKVHPRKMSDETKLNKLQECHSLKITKLNKQSEQNISKARVLIEEK